MKLSKAQKGWVIFDCANSAYYLIINTAIFPILFGSIVHNGTPVFGSPIKSSEALFQMTISIAYALIVLLSPILSGIADYSNSKKMFMRIFTTLGALACFSLYFFDENHIELGLIAAALAMIGFSGSLVFYNAYLPEIATHEEQDKLSALGFSVGYAGSTILLIIIIALASLFKDDSLEVYALGFVAVGLWWLGFSQYTFKHLPADEKIKISFKQAFSHGFAELKKVGQQIKSNNVLKKFISTYFFISMGVQTLILIAPLFALQNLKLATSDLLIIILIMQGMGILGAWLTAKISDAKGNFNALYFPLSIFALVCGSVIFVHNANAFYLLGALIGLSMGGVQAVARSTYSKLLPPTHDHASFFSFYDIAEKVAITFGTFLTGFIAYITSGKSQYGILSLSLLFLIALFLLKLTQKEAQHNGTKI
ncbi:MAG: MFS transporter [Flavobacteriales bacterium]